MNEKILKLVLYQNNTIFDTFLNFKLIPGTLIHYFDVRFVIVISIFFFYIDVSRVLFINNMKYLILSKNFGDDAVVNRHRRLCINDSSTHTH